MFRKREEEKRRFMQTKKADGFLSVLYAAGSIQLQEGTVRCFVLPAVTFLQKRTSQSKGRALRKKRSCGNKTGRRERKPPSADRIPDL